MDRLIDTVTSLGFQELQSAGWHSIVTSQAQADLITTLSNPITARLTDKTCPQALKQTPRSSYTNKANHFKRGQIGSFRHHQRSDLTNGKTTRCSFRCKITTETEQQQHIVLRVISSNTLRVTSSNTLRNTLRVTSSNTLRVTSSNTLHVTSSNTLRNTLRVTDSVLNSERARKTHRASPLPPPPPPQEPSTMVPKCTLGCPEHNLTCSPDSHWDTLELQPFAQGYPLAFTRELTESRSLMHHLNHLYIIVS